MSDRILMVIAGVIVGFLVLVSGLTYFSSSQTKGPKKGNQTQAQENTAQPTEEEAPYDYSSSNSTSGEDSGSNEPAAEPELSPEEKARDEEIVSQIKNAYANPREQGNNTYGAGNFIEAKVLKNYSDYEEALSEAHIPGWRKEMDGDVWTADGLLNCQSRLDKQISDELFIDACLVAIKATDKQSGKNVLYIAIAMKTKPDAAWNITFNGPVELN